MSRRRRCNAAKPGTQFGRCGRYLGHDGPHREMCAVETWDDATTNGGQTVDLRAKAERAAGEYHDMEGCKSYEGGSCDCSRASRVTELENFAREVAADELRALRAEIQQLYIMLDNIVAALDRRLGVK